MNEQELLEKAEQTATALRQHLHELTEQKRKIEHEVFQAQMHLRDVEGTIRHLKAAPAAAPAPAPASAPVEPGPVAIPEPALSPPPAPAPGA